MTDEAMELARKESGLDSFLAFLDLALAKIAPLGEVSSSSLPASCGGK